MIKAFTAVCLSLVAVACQNASPNSNVKDAPVSAPASSSGVELADGALLTSVSNPTQSTGEVMVASATVAVGSYLVDGKVVDSNTFSNLPPSGIHVGYCTVDSDNGGIGYAQAKTVAAGMKDEILSLEVAPVEANSSNQGQIHIILNGGSGASWSGLECYLQAGVAATASMTYGQFKAITGNSFVIRAPNNGELAAISAGTDAIIAGDRTAYCAQSDALASLCASSN